MATNKQDREEEWERERVQRALDYHNERYRAHIEIKGKATDVYPQLEGQLNWDWVCYDTETGEEIAVEVKKLLDPRLEERGNIVWQLLEEVRNSLSKSQKLPGTFILYVDIPNNYYLPFSKQRNRQEFKNLLYEAIYKTAQRLKSGETEDLKPQIVKQLPFVLPDFFLHLRKFSDAGDVLIRSSGFTGLWSPQLDEHELKEFETLVSHANTQLSQANVKQTFLVIIEEGHRLTNSNTIADALKRANRNSYSQINYVYYVSGKVVAEIPLPIL